MSTQIDWSVPEFTMGDRMRKALEYNGYSVQQASDYFGVTRGTVSNWIHGRSPVPLASQRLWALWTGVPLEWLQSGKVVAGDDGRLTAPVDDYQNSHNPVMTGRSPRSEAA